MSPSVRNSTKKAPKSSKTKSLVDRFIDNRLLTTCWFEVSKLFAARADPSKDDFWTTIAVVYNQSGVSGPPEDEVRLRKRWEKIRTDTMEFVEYYQEVKPRYQESEKALVRLAMDKFQESQGYRFEFEYLWESQLRYRDDWMEEDETRYESEQESDGSSADSSVEVRSGGRMNRTDSTLNARPGGGKLPETAGDRGPDSIEQLQLTVQSLLEKLETAAPGNSGTNPAAAKTPSAAPDRASNNTLAGAPHGGLLNNQTNLIDKMYEENERESIRIDQARLALEQDQNDIDIIDKDLALLPDDEARQYYRVKKEAILAALQAQTVNEPSSSVPAASSSKPTAPVPAYTTFGCIPRTG